MDLKKNRRDAVATGQVWDQALPQPEGMYPGPKGHGTAASDNNIGWDMRAQSWQRGADSDFASIENEKREQDLRWGTPHADNLPNPATQSNNADAPLPNPHNFSSNPGFMGTSEMSSMGGPANGGTARISTPGSGRSLRGTGTLGRTAVASTGNVALPAPGDVNPGQEGGPQVVSSGYSG
jgi:hypothetical protein